MRIGQVLLLVVAVLLFFLGGRHYNVRQVLGIKQIKEGTLNKAISDREAAFAGSASLMVGISIFIITLIKMVITKVLNTPHSKKGAFCLLSAVAGPS